MQPGDAIATIIKRILTLEPEHALKIIGYILFQDFGHTELIRLAFCPALHYKVTVKKLNPLWVFRDPSISITIHCLSLPQEMSSWTSPETLTLCILR